MVCAGYKWLLSPYGTGFFWAKNEHTDKMRPGPFYWAAAEGAENFTPLPSKTPSPPAARAVGTLLKPQLFQFRRHGRFAAVRPASWTRRSLCPQSQINRFAFRTPPERPLRPASPLDSSQRGPYGCFAARSPEKTASFMTSW